MKRNIDKTKFINVCNEAYSMADASRKLNMAFSTFKRYAEQFGCYTTNQGGIGIRRNNSNYWTAEKLKRALDDNSLTLQPFKLKNHLLKHGFKKQRCEKCGLTEWNNQPIPVELHHIDGNTNNNTLDNIQLLCPNCHAQTANYRSKNKRTGAADQK